jgi:hypothetical protein
MKLSCALVACNENTHYLDFWPAVKRAWNSIVNIPCKMVYVGDIPHPTLKDDPDVFFFQAIPEWPTATQAQCIRLLYPALLHDYMDGAIVISDMDMVPMQSDFFVKGFSPFQENQFVSLRGISEEEKQIYMCYVGATPNTWGDLFGIKTLEDIQCRMKEWSQQYLSNGLHGSIGWFSDQLILYNYVKQFPEERVGTYPCVPIPRVDRIYPYVWASLSDTFQKDLQNKKFVDFHMPPYNSYNAIINKIIDCVIQIVPT